jgi:hypothetical protein
LHAGSISITTTIINTIHRAMCHPSMSMFTTDATLRFRSYSFQTLHDAPKAPGPFVNIIAGLS